MDALLDRSKTFDVDADGYGRGEGCVAFVLQASGMAPAAAAPPLAVLQGKASLDHFILSICFTT